MSLHRGVALAYFVVLTGAAAINYIPGLTDENGVAFGVFELDIGDDALHLASALWALVAAVISTRASRIFLGIFGALYLFDGLLGLATGSGCLDLGIFRYGIQDLDFTFKLMASGPHIVLGATALAIAFIRP